MFSSQYGKTPLHHASQRGHPEVVKTLVQSHSDVIVKDNVSTESHHQYHLCKSGKFTVEIFLLLREATKNNSRFAQPLI
jgi:ankyrin repeat protein